MAHDPLCKHVNNKNIEWHLCACCAWVREIRADQDRRNAAAELTRLGQEMGMIP